MVPSSSGDDTTSGVKANRGHRRSVPIAVALVASVGLLVLVATALVYLVGYEVARRNTVELVRQRGGLIIDRIEERIHGHLDPVRVQLEYLARQIAGGRIDHGNRIELGEVMVASLAAVPQVSVVAFVNPELRVLRAFRRRIDGPVVESDWSDDPVFRKIFANAAQQSEVHWGELFVAESVGQTFLNLRLPVRRNGHFYGVLIAAVSIAELSQFLGQLRDDAILNSFILLGPDRLLAHPYLLHLHAGLSDENPLPTLVGFADPVLSEIWSERRDLNAEAVLSGRAEARVVEYLGRTYVFMFRALGDFGATPWLVGAYQSYDEVSLQYRRLDLIPLFGLGVLAVALLVAYALARGLTRPVRQLADGVARIRRLDIAGIPPLPPGPFRELNQAATAFNAMVASLKLFETYVPRSLVRRLIRHRDGGEIVSEEREVTVLFTDIQGFTPLAERLPAPALASLLNDHFTLIDRAIEAEAGTLDKYMGDAVMAFWGAPERQSDHAVRACRAATQMIVAIEADNARRRAAAEPSVRVRIGVHTGSVVVGNIGAPGRINYTIVGDAVNTAERLSELAREVLDDVREDAVVCISGDTAARLDTSFDLTALGMREIRGRKETVAVHRLRLRSEPEC